MDALRFLESVLSDGGIYCLFAAQTKPKKIIQTFYDTAGELYEDAKAFDAKGFDTYFALSAFNERGSRKVDNVKQTKSLFLDIDCGPSKDYPDKESGIKALQQFCNKLTLPSPNLVDSGRGIHAYWVLSHPVSLTEWLPVAEQLKRKCTELGFNVDPAVTADAARVLRVPGTHNYKDNPPNKVFIVGTPKPPVNLDGFYALLGEGATPVPHLAGQSFSTLAGSSAVMDILSGNTRGVFKNILQKTKAGKGCEQIKVIYKKQATIDEPMWRAGLSIANACVDGEDAARLISSKHPQYDEDETLAKMRRIQGPYLCERFNEFNPGVCEKCPNYGRIKSPIVLGKEFAEVLEGEFLPDRKLKVLDEQITEISALPKGYRRGQGGGIFKRCLVTDDSTGETSEINMEVYMHNLYATKRIYDPVHDGECVVMRVHLPQDGMREFTIPLTAVTSPDKLRDSLSRQGIVPTSWKLIMPYVTDWIAELQARLPASNAHNQFGWTEDHKSFLIGNKEYTADKILDNPPSAATAQYTPAFQQRGTLEGWKDMIKFYDRPGMELYQYVIGCAFGSPLMDFVTNVPAAMLHIHSKDTGLGKTTAMWAANSVWGNYKLLTVSANDTVNFLFNRADVYKNITLCIDEVTNNDPESLSSLAYQIPEGQQKGRMGNGTNVERARGNPWSFIAVSTGNTSVIDRVSNYKEGPLAELQRVLEARVTKFDFEGIETTTWEFNNALSENYGHAGPVYVQYLMQNPEKCQKILFDTIDEVIAVCKLTEQNRFWIAQIGCVIAGIRIANLCELLPFNSGRVLDHMNGVTKQAKQRGREMRESTEDTFNAYLADIRGNTLVMDSSVHGNGLDTLSVPLRDPYQKLFARVDPLPDGASTVYLRKKPLREWCVGRQTDYGAFVEGLTEDFKAKDVKVRLLRGTPLAGTPATSVLQIDLPPNTNIPNLPTHAIVPEKA